MKRFFLSFSGIVVMVAFFSACYYISFRNTVKELEDNKTRQETMLPELMSENEEVITESAGKRTNSVEWEEVSVADDIITAACKT